MSDQQKILRGAAIVVLFALIVLASSNKEELHKADSDPFALTHFASLRGETGTPETNRAPRYLLLDIRPSQGERFNISEWRIGKRNSRRKLGQATHLPLQNKASLLQDILITREARVVIVSGHSPLGYSFRVNKCTGYFDQFQEFTPVILHNCPLISKRTAENLSGSYPSDICLAYLGSLPECRVKLADYPADLLKSCQDFGRDYLNYSSCVRAHEGDHDFLTNEWRFYLGQDEELWNSEGDIIKLWDENGTLIETFSY